MQLGLNKKVKRKKKKTLSSATVLELQEVTEEFKFFDHKKEHEEALEILPQEAGHFRKGCT